jgi:Fe-S-cluster containining protein
MKGAHVTRKTRTRLMKGRSKGGSKRACTNCPALCCHDLAIPIDRPRLKEDIDDLKWQLRYDVVHVAIRHRQWYLAVNGRCIYLDRNDLCTIYDERPPTCREHNPPDCEKYSRWYEYWIETPEQLDSYLSGKRRGLSRPSPHCSRGRLLNNGKAR